MDFYAIDGGLSEQYPCFEPYDAGNFLPDSEYNCQTVVGIDVPCGWLPEEIQYDEIKERLSAKEVAFKSEDFQPPGKLYPAKSKATFFDCHSQDQHFTLVLHAAPIQGA